MSLVFCQVLLIYTHFIKFIVCQAPSRAVIGNTIFCKWKSNALSAQGLWGSTMCRCCLCEKKHNLNLKLNQTVHGIIIFTLPSACRVSHIHPAAHKARIWVRFWFVSCVIGITLCKENTDKCFLCCFVGVVELPQMFQSNFLLS